jgi:hypothetical protein
MPSSTPTNLHNTISDTFYSTRRPQYRHLNSQPESLNQILHLLALYLNFLAHPPQLPLFIARGAVTIQERRYGPSADEILSAPTVVGRQLHDVVCEERGIEAGIWTLRKGS